VKVAAYTREAWYAAVKDFIWSKSKEFSLTGKELDDPRKKDLKPGNTALLAAEKPNSKKDLITRRYKVFLSDLEKAMVYSLSHEVGQHSAIAGESLIALQKYITVLDAYFPSRPEVEVFISELHTWIHAHQDVVRGEDLVDKINTFVGDHGVRVNPAWVGCQGSKAMYGGYPCGLWSLWHTLTISQAELGTGEPKDVLVAMQGFVKNFFGCTECARHFDQTIQQGQGIKENVQTHKDSVLYLWNIHNRVNVRLSGDTSEDPSFPKLVFPEKRFCAKCYNDMTGSDLWHEFDREEVYSFLRSLFSAKKISKQGLMGDEVDRIANHEGVGEASNLEENLENLDLDNYREKSSKGANLIFFNGADISLCLVLWLSSAALIVLLYLKFVMKRRLSNAAIMSLLKRKTSYNPLVGKV